MKTLNGANQRLEAGKQGTKDTHWICVVSRSSRIFRPGLVSQNACARIWGTAEGASASRDAASYATAASQSI